MALCLSVCLCVTGTYVTQGLQQWGIAKVMDTSSVHAYDRDIVLKANPA